MGAGRRRAALLGVLVLLAGLATLVPTAAPAAAAPVTVTARLSLPTFLTVQAFRADELTAEPVVDWAGEYGGFSIQLEPGDWKLRVVSEEGDFATEWYGDANSFDAAAVVRVGATPLDLGTLTVSEGGTLEGRVRDAQGGAARKLQVEAVAPDGQVLFRNVSTDTGWFRLTRLSPGRYHVRVSDRTGLVPTTTSAQVTLGQDETRTGVEVVVPRVALGTPSPAPERIAGRVVDAAGRPLPGVVVEAADCPDLTNVWTTSAADGRFVLDGLDPTRSHRLRFDDTALGRSEGGVQGYDHVPVWSGGAADCEDAALVPVGTLDADAVLTPYGGLSGSLVTDVPLELDVRAFLLPDDDPRPPSFDLYAYSGPGLQLYVQDGTFSTASIPPGRYKLLLVDVDDSNYVSIATWWPAAATWETAGVLEVAPDSEGPALVATATAGRLVAVSAARPYRNAEVGEELEPNQLTIFGAASWAWQWVRDDGLVRSTTSRWTPTADDAGHRFAISVTAGRGQDTVTVTSRSYGPVLGPDLPPQPPPEPPEPPEPPTPPTPQPPTPSSPPPAPPPAPTATPARAEVGVRARTSRSRPGRVQLRVTVSAGSGVLRVIEDGVLVLRRNAVAGRPSTLVLRNQRPGRHTYEIAYLAEGPLLGGRTTVRVRVPAVSPARPASG